MHLSAETVSSGYRLLSLEATESTNDDALKAAREGDPGRLWIAAREQKAGRGRHGRQWSSPPGNLYASLLLIDPCEASVAPQLGFVAGLALHEAIESVTGIGPPRLGLKWPNDCLLDGAKLSGLLLEGHRVRDRLAIIIGFGVNVTWAPADTPYQVATIAAVAPTATREVVFEALSRSFARALEAWQVLLAGNASDPFGPIRRLWLERAVGIGGEVALRLPTGERRGTFEGLDRFGRLQLKTSAGVELIDAGDLYFFPNLNRTTAAVDRPVR